MILELHLLENLIDYPKSQYTLANVHRAAFEVSGELSRVSEI